MTSEVGSIIAFLGMLAVFAWFAWLVMRDGGPVIGGGIQLPPYEPDYFTTKTYTGPARCPHCGKAITADDMAAMLDGDA